MIRVMTLRAWPLMLLTAGPVAADDPKAPPAETVIRLTVDPAATPKPALKYLFVPAIVELKAGNGVIHLYKCQMEQTNFYHSPESVAQREKYLKVALDELPSEKLLDYGGYSTRWADYAVRHEYWDWQLVDKIRAEGFSLLLPDVQTVRAVASALKVRFRAEVKEGKWDAATRTATTMFGIAYHLGRHPTLIGQLVGVAIGTLAVGPLEEMIGRPGSPNFYWALANLPAPFADLKTSLVSERALFLAEFPGLFTETTPKSDAEMLRHILKFRQVVPLMTENPKSAEAIGKILESAKDEAAVAASRKRLLEAGVPEDHVRQMPAVQAVILDEWKRYEVIRDDHLKWAAVPFPQSEGRLPKSKGESAFSDLLPAVEKVKGALTRFDQRLNLLRAVEAVRMFAAENGGKLPPSLADCPVPVPADPFTGKPFGYEVRGETAVISGATPEVFRNAPGYNVRYEVTVRKK